jgi:hypothetical protein
MSQLSDPRSEATPGTGVVTRDRCAETFDLDAFLARLRRMGAQERLMASRYEFTQRERTIWAARYPDEVPLLGGEFEWIAANLE